MKMKIKICLLIALLLLNTTFALKTTRLKRKKGVFVIVSFLVTGAFQLIADEYQDYTRKKMIDFKLKSIQETEGIQRLFMQDMLRVCKSSLSARTLNSELLFKFKLQLEKLKESPDQIEYEDKSDQEIIDEFKKFYEENKNHPFEEEKPEETEKIGKQIAKNLKFQLNNHIITKFSGIHREITLIAEKDLAATETICNGKLEKEAFRASLGRSYSKINELMEELEKTDNLIELLRNPEERRAQWTALEEAYGKEGAAPKELPGRLKRTFRAGLKLASLFLPLAKSIKSEYKTVFNAAKTVYLSDGIMESIKPLLDLGFNTSLGMAVKEIGKKLFSNASGLILGALSIFKSVKKIVKSRTRMIQEEKQSLTGITEVTKGQKLNLNNLQMIQLSQNSIFIYRMLANLVEINAPTFSSEHSNEIKQICEENLLLCSKELGVSYVREQFSSKIICPKDIFIEEENKNSELLGKLHFDLFARKFEIEYDLYLNYFFSLSKKGILDVTLNGEKSFLDSFISKIKKSEHFDEKHCGDIEKEISLEVWNLGEKEIHLIKAPEIIISRCVTMKLEYCKKGSDFFGTRKKQKTSKKPKMERILKDLRFKLHSPESQNIIKRRNTVKLTDSAVKNQTDQKRNAALKRSNSADVLTFLQLKDYKLIENTSKLSKILLEEVCTIAQQPIKIFSEEDKMEMRKWRFTSSDAIVKARHNGNGVYIGNIKKFFELRKFERKKLSLTYLDWILISKKESPFNLPTKIEYNATNSYQVIVKMFVEKIEKLKEDHFINFYSSGEQYCNANFLVRGAKDLYNNSEITHKQKDKSYYSDADTHLLDLYSVIGRIQETSFQIKDVEGNIPLRQILDRDNFIFNEEKTRLNVKDRKSFGYCKYAFQFIKVKLKGNPRGKGLKYKFGEDDSLRIPTLEVEPAEKGDLAFENELFVMVYSVAYNNDLKAEKDRQEVFKGISMKMAHFGYFGLAETAFGDKKTVLVHDAGIIYDSEQGKIGFEVFLKPYEDKEETEKNKEVCKTFD